MARRMLIDATHPEQTRVAVVNGHKLEEFDFETVSRKQLKGNIYLAKVIRIEPSLQAAFVEYGGNRHGFLAFTEIHHDYYRIPVADRQALEAEISASSAMGGMDAGQGDFGNAGFQGGSEEDLNVPFHDEELSEEHISQSALPPAVSLTGSSSGPMLNPFAEQGEAGEPEDMDAGFAGDENADMQEEGGEPSADMMGEGNEAGQPVDVVGGDEVERHRDQNRRRFIRRYKIQEVIKRGQIMLIQVVKEERGNKGAALTTYLSLAGRYCVLMPNTDRGGGISRKITSMQDRRRMKDLLEDLETPNGMAVILRTAGMERTKIEVRRDLEYLLRLWDSIREMTLNSIAPSLVYEEANLIKRAIRDLYTPDIDSILVEGEDGYHRAREFMRMLMPSHARRVHHYRDHIIPLFFRYQVENQINALHSPIVTLRSGGYIVINQAEALVAIDVNSGRSTRERNIEETAYRTNMEASEEIARQLRLRDLAGLIVIDFIDMEDGRNNAAVERRLKDAMRNDRARLQIGRISHFGLLELSRQRLRPSLIDLNFEKCSHCHGTGYIRLVESSALLALHAMEEEGIRQNASEITISMPTPVSLYILNHKRDAMADIEKRYGFTINIRTREDVIPPEFPIERVRVKKAGEQLPIHQMITDQQIFDDLDREAAEAEEAESMSTQGEETAPAFNAGEEVFEGDDEAMPADNSGSAFSDSYGGSPRMGDNQGGEGDGRRRRRGRRGGRRRSGREGGRDGGNRDGGGRYRDNYEQRPPREGFGDAGPMETGAMPTSFEGEGQPNVTPDGQPIEGARFEGPREGGRRDGRRDGRNRRGGRDRNNRHGGGHRQEGQGNRERGNWNRDERPRDIPIQVAPPVQVPASVFELDTTPRETPLPRTSGFGQAGAPDNASPRAAENVNVPPEKKKSGWWQRLTGAS